MARSTKYTHPYKQHKRMALSATRGSPRLAERNRKLHDELSKRCVFRTTKVNKKLHGYLLKVSEFDTGFFASEAWWLGCGWTKEKAKNDTIEQYLRVVRNDGHEDKLYRVLFRPN